MDDVSTSAPCRSQAPRSLAWLIAALVFAVIRALPSLSYPIARDQATYCVIGQGLLDGQQLYRDLWDNKPPGIFYVFGVLVKIFGHGIWWVGFVDVLWLLGISYLIFRFAQRYLGAAPAAIAVAVHAVWHVRGGYWSAAQTETFLLLFVFAAYFAAARDGRWPKLRHLIAGISFAAAFWLKYNAIAFLPLVMVLPYFDLTSLEGRRPAIRFTVSWRQWLTRALVFVAGFGGIACLVLGYFWFAGSWAALKEVQFEVLPRYSAIALERTPYYGLWAIDRTQSVIGPLTECATLVALLIAWRQRELGKAGPILLAALLGYISVAVQVRFHGYAFEVCYPFFAMIWAYVAIKIFRGFRALAKGCAERGWGLARVLIWVLFANVVFWPVPREVSDTITQYRSLAEWWRDRNAFYASYPWAHPVSHLPDQWRVISYLQANLTPGDKVFVWGSEPLIYFLSRHDCPVRFVTNLALLAPWSPPRWRVEMVRQLEKSPPRFLVVARDDQVSFITYTDMDSEQFLEVYPELAIFIGDYYQPAEDFRGFVIYQRKMLSGNPG